MQAFLSNISLDHLVNPLYNYGIKYVEDLQYITTDDLEKAGVDKAFERRKLVDKIKSLQPSKRSPRKYVSQKVSPVPRRSIHDRYEKMPHRRRSRSRSRDRHRRNRKPFRKDKCNRYYFDGMPSIHSRRPDLFKTKLCQNFEQGRCSNKLCNFAHGRKELRCFFCVKGICRSGQSCWYQRRLNASLDKSPSSTNNAADVSNPLSCDRHVSGDEEQMDRKSKERYNSQSSSSEDE